MDGKGMPVIALALAVIPLSALAALLWWWAGTGSTWTVYWHLLVQIAAIVIVLAGSIAIGRAGSNSS